MCIEEDDEEFFILLSDLKRNEEVKQFYLNNKYDVDWVNKRMDDEENRYLKAYFMETMQRQEEYTRNLFGFE